MVGSSSAEVVIHMASLVGLVVVVSSLINSIWSVSVEGVVHCSHLIVVGVELTVHVVVVHIIVIHVIRLDVLMLRAKTAALVLDHFVRANFRLNLLDLLDFVGLFFFEIVD